MKAGGLLSDDMSSHIIHVDRSQSRCVSPRMDTLILNGSSVNRSQSRVVCPGPVSVSQTDSYNHCPSERWVCREIKMSPPNLGSQSQNRSASGLGRSQTISVRSISNQKPPIHDGVRRTTSAQVIVTHSPGASHETARASEQHFRNRPGSKPNCAEDEPLSPSLDATIENLNNLILELDPSFQPINCCVSGAKKSYIQSSNNRHLDQPSEDSSLDGHSPGILIYDEWDSRTPRNTQHNGSMSINGRDRVESPELRVHTSAISNIAPYHQMPNIPRYNMPNAGQTDSTSIFLHGVPSSSISSTPQFLSSSPDSRNAEMFTCQPTQSSKGTTVQIPFQVQEHLYASPASSISTSLLQGSQPIQMPTSSGYSASSADSLPTAPQQYGTLPISTGIRREPASSCLSISPGSNNLLKSCHAHRTRLTDSANSLLSTSPGRDTLGSSHSLLSDDGEAGRIYGSAGSTYGSSGSFANLQSPYLVSPSSVKSSLSEQLLHQTSGQPEYYQTMPHPRGATNPTSRHPTSGSMGGRVVQVHHDKTTYQIKEHPSSCPASAASSYSDIPLLLVNGSTQYLDQNSHRPKNKRLQSSSSSNLSLPINACSSIGSSKASSTTFLEDLPCDAQPTVKFVQDTTKYWYKPNMRRDQAIEMLKDKEPGSFIIRESSTYVGSFGLALKVPSSSLGNPEKKTGDSPIELVRHFLIEFSPKGVCLKGSPQEPFFGSLSALVYQHSITNMSLPCKLSLPRKEYFSEESSPDSMDITEPPLRKQVCKVLYLNSVTMESLTGPQAVLRAASITLEQQPRPGAIIVQFKVSERGVTLTDSKRKLFFRRHYAAGTVNHCGLDPLQRKWRKDNEPSRVRERPVSSPDH
ncbi:tensin-4-like isoform X2 [Heptranchias perlo]|uniref:tensin-4-like isoform X2 n=1 Tax=Heptranchias perlo TaxID=212740 RepID=UPI0035599324